ncbi:MAG: glycosyltransferase family 39 protein [Acidobacteriia bacterium]|nr:glycosyltransferase family 39 protein [Terriglobia bacterium]
MKNTHKMEPHAASLSRVYLWGLAARRAPFTLRIFLVLLLAGVTWLLYFYGLDRVGLLSADEPRYASIGREMARSSDWVTPRLWGEPWFEKPVLLYWLIGAGFRLGLPDELAARVPVALFSVCFLVFYWWWLSRQFDTRIASYSTLILSTSAGWLSFSQTGVTDLPLSASFAAAMLLAMPWATGGSAARLPLAGALMGVAVLAKGLVPLILAGPLLWFGLWHRRPRHLVLPFLIAATVSLPWYLLCYKLHGSTFFNDLIIKQHFSRFFTNELQHGQPFWFYLPVLAAGLFPWTPLLGLLYYLKDSFHQDIRIRYLTAWFVMGFLFFSLSNNKLPGYLVPLLPAAAALIGIHLAQGSIRVRAWLASCALLLSLIPVIGLILPEALREGLSRTTFPPIQWTYPIAGLAAAGLILRWGTPHRDRSLALLTVGILLGVLSIKQFTYPRLDEMVSARGIWRRIAHPDQVCLEALNRTIVYGLNFYSGTPLPLCEDQPRLMRLIERNGEVVMEKNTGPAGRAERLQ